MHLTSSDPAAVAGVAMRQDRDVRLSRFSTMVLLLAISFLGLSGVGTSATASLPIVSMVVGTLLLLPHANLLRPAREVLVYGGVVVVAYSVSEIYWGSVGSESSVIVRAAVVAVLVSVVVERLVRVFGSTREVTLAFASGVALSVVYGLVSVFLLGNEIGRVVRVAGLSSHSNLLGIYAAAALVLLLSHSGTPLVWALRCVLAAGLVFAGSRSALLLVCVALVAYGLPTRSSKLRISRGMLVTAALIVGALIWLPQTRLLIDRVTARRAVTGDVERLELLNAGIDLLADNWLTGGPYEGRLFHNFYLTHGALLGIFAMLAAVYVVVVSNLWAWRARSQDRTGFALVIAVAVTLFVHNVVLEPALWFMLLLPLAVRNAEDCESARGID